MGFGYILFIIFMVGAVVAVLRWQKQKDKEVIDAVNEIEISDFKDELLQITPNMKQSLENFSVSNASELRGLNSGDLMNLLSCAADVITVFERRIEKISSGFEMFENNLDDIFSSAKTRRIREERMMPHKKRLEEQLEQAMTIFDEDLLGVEGVLNVIPEQYRMSLILRTMSKYLSDGEAGSWEDCIRIFKDDIFKMQQNENFSAVINRLDRIEKNTKASAFFAGLTAYNTARISSKL